MVEDESNASSGKANTGQAARVRSPDELETVVEVTDTRSWIAIGAAASVVGVMSRPGVRRSIHATAIGRWGRSGANLDALRERPSGVCVVSRADA